MFDPASIDAFLFDLDGTLMDTDDQAVEALARRIGWLGLRDPQRAARRLVMAMETPANGLMTALDLVGLDNAMGGLSNLLHRWRGERTVSNFRPVSGVSSALRALAERYRLAVVTTRGRRDAEMFLESAGIADLFGLVVTRESTWRLKPHPAPILYAAQEMGLKPERCAMVGDTTVDVRSARRAGAWAVAVLCGFGEREELERAGAHLIFPSPVDLGVFSATGP